MFSRAANPPNPSNQYFRPVLLFPSSILLSPPLRERERGTHSQRQQKQQRQQRQAHSYGPKTNKHTDTQGLHTVIGGGELRGGGTKESGDEDGGNIGCSDSSMFSRESFIGESNVKGLSEVSEPIAPPMQLRI